MIPIAGNESRRLVPRWRSLATTLKSKELDQPIRATAVSGALPAELTDRLMRWRMSRDLTTAAELVESALVTGCEPEGVEAARRLLHPDLSARMPIRMQAATLLVRAGQADDVPEEMRTCRALDASACRALARANPQDPMAWVDLALYQTVRHQKNPAKRSMAMALRLAPYNRHVLRCAARRGCTCTTMTLKGLTTSWHETPRQPRTPG